MTILRLPIRLFAPCIFDIFKPTIFRLWILLDVYIKINDTFGFFDLFSKSSEIELGLGLWQITF
jgi:hypothetical protein